MAFSPFTPAGSNRLTPDIPQRLLMLLGYWLGVVLSVATGIAAAVERDANLAVAAATVAPFVVLAVFSRRALSVGVFADETALRLHSGSQPLMISYDRVEAFTVRPHREKSRVLWVDLRDGRRYPTPTFVGTGARAGMIALTDAEMATLLAELTQRAALPQPAA
ncbi:hypothetical protein [Catellatospora chokoriensis]|uniref:Uncharacterized protein n=1 Tax=Catellatospora chokoriensis TaxID=310353 RepID=A0A8J3K2G2_9ACTN|nr:hypothetical protein [Catellatospora chokoriensis]GIF89490.1 hypothetical protein Cch02nite_29340 [Catellatospora chokoriensis]